MTKIVYTAGTWDLFHIGHLNIIKMSKKLGNYLIIAVSTDELAKSYKHTPFFPYSHRFRIIQALKYPDKVVKQTELIKIQDLIDYKVDVVTIADSWKDKPLKGLEWMERQGKEVVYLPYTKSISSSIIREKILAKYLEEKEEGKGA